MSWNGLGVFQRLYSWVADDNAGIDIIASRMDADTDNITTAGFGNCLTRDGQGSATANLPMNGFKHTGAAIGVADTDYATMIQLNAIAALIGAAPVIITGGSQTITAANGIFIVKNTVPTATILTLPASGGTFTFVDGAYNCATYPITLLTPGGVTIAQLPQLVMQFNGQSTTIIYDGTSNYCVT